MIVGVAGKKQHGKDTFYQLLKEIHTSVERYSFADEVKRYAAIYFGVDATQQDKEKYRFILQGIGQMMRDQVDKSYWIQIVKSQIDLSTARIKCITDVRYKNEVDYVKNSGGIMVRVINPRIHNHDVHLSENDLNEHCDYDYVIHNDSTIQDYRQKVVSCLQHMTAKGLLLP